MEGVFPLGWFYWDPPKYSFVIPYFEIPIAWYGIFFASGFLIAYFILIPMFARYLQVTEGPLNLSGSIPAIAETKAISTSIVDTLTWYVILGTVVGARLGHVLFYDLPYYVDHPWEVFNLRQGGLASHGGTVGVMLALWLFLRRNRKTLPKMTYINLIDILVIPTCIVAFFIRLGNFFNQEILGNPTNLPWGIIFGHPADGTVPTPRHPVQLYEAFFYLGTFFLLYTIWKKRYEKLKAGTLSGIFFIITFGSRFFLDFLKTPQSMLLDESVMQMGQYLSVPFVILGVALLFWPESKQKEPT